MPPFRAQFTSAAILATVGAALFGIAQGSWILAGGSQRWNGPSVSVIRQLPGAPISWGVWALLGGVLTAAGLIFRVWMVKAVGLLALSVWAAVFGIGALAAAVTINTVPTTGGPTYLTMSVLLAVLVNYRTAQTGDD